MKFRRISLSIFMVLFLAVFIAGNALSASSATKEDGIGGTGVVVGEDGIGGTGAPAMSGGIGGTGLRPESESAVLPIAGKVLFVIGQVEAQNMGKARSLIRGGVVRVGDRLQTSKGALLQLRMEDGGTILLRSESQLTIETFVYEGVQDGRERISLALLKGGGRAITGAIGKLHKENYSLRTPNATVSIRGTDHETIFVPEPQPGRVAPVAPGTYNRVISGATLLQTQQGNLLIKPNQTGFAPLRGGIPIFLDTPLPIFSTPDAKAKGYEKRMESINNSDKGSLENISLASNMVDMGRPSMENFGINAVTPQSNEIIQPILLANGAVDLNATLAAVVPAGPGSAVVGAHISCDLLAAGGARDGNSGETLLVNDSGLPSAYSNDATNFNFLANDAPLADYGAAVVDGVSVSWGVYAGGIAFDPSGNAITVDFHPFAFVNGGATPLDVVSAMSGSVTFSNVVGYTQPATELGGLGGSVTSLNVGIDLGANAAVTSYNLGVTDVHGRNWSGAFAGNVAISSFAQSGVPLSVTCGGGTCGSGSGSGNAVGMLIGPNAKGLISSYTLSTTTGQAVAGAVVMSRP